MTNKKIAIPNHLKSVFLLGLLCLWQLPLQASPVKPGPVLKAFEAHYTFRKKGIIVAKSKRQLTINGDRVEYQSHTKASGVAKLFVKDTITEKSIMVQDKKGLKPLSYSYERKGGKKYELIKLDFDWSKQLVNNSYLKKELPLPENTFDILGFQIILSQQLAAGNKAIQFNVAEKKRIKTYSFSFKGTEKIKLPVANSPTNTIHLGFYDKEKKRQLDIWAAPSLNFLPVRIKRTDEDGDITLLEYYQPGYLDYWSDSEED